MLNKERKVDPARMAFLRSLPTHIKESITGEEAELLMYGEDIPETLYLKIKDYLVESDE